MDNLIFSDNSYHQLITNDFSRTMYEELTSSLSNCKSFLFSVAFINYSGLQLLLRALTDFENKNIKGKIITSDYLNFTDTKSLRKLKEFKNIDTKIYLAQHDRGFHSKAYIFEYEDTYKIIIGSSNITQSALKSNVEWNVKIITKSDHAFTVKVIKEFDELWAGTTVIDERFLAEYERLIQMIHESNEKEQEIFYIDHEVVANTMQIKAIENLRWLR
ncbi:MAG: phospholipase D-like domain-containing protein, partial [Erysipelotrichaceae bacterium]